MNSQPREPFSKERVSELIRTKAVGDPKGTWDSLTKLEGNSRELAESRDEFVAELVSKMGLKAALDVVFSLTGQGADRDRCITRAFDCSRENAEVLLNLLEGFKNGRERAAAVNGLQWKTLDLTTFDNLKSMSKECTGLYLDRLSMSVSGSSNQLSQVKGCLATINKKIVGGSLPAGFRSDFLAMVSKGAPFIAWDLGMDPQNGELTSRPELLKGIARNMAAADPLKAMTTLKGQEGNEALLGEAFSIWLAKDEKASLAWYQESGSVLTGTETSQLASILSKYEVSHGKIAEAWKLVDQISDPNLKTQTSGRVWQAERKQLQAQVSAKPAQVVDSIVSGTSTFADYWLEEAMFTWISKDNDKAIDWYEKNSKSLPASKAQYVAAAFATQCLQQKEIEVAREWAALIQDSKTKARIDAAIAKAANP